MDKNLIFFGDKGLTSTSANHIANMAKEEYQKHEATIQSIRLYDTTAELIGSGSEITIYHETPKYIFDNVPLLIQRISDLNSLIAWLREAISAKTTLGNIIKNTTLSEYCNRKGIAYPKKRDDIKFPITEDEYYGSLNVAQRNEYYSLEATAATIGKYIHPDGVISDIRNNFNENIVINPSSIAGSGRDMVITRNTSSTTLDDIDKVFFGLQRSQREAQAKLNSYKFDCEKAVAEDYLRYTQEIKEDTLRYNQEMDMITQEWHEWVKRETTLISDYKIIIPKNLTDIFNEVNSLGK